MPSITTDGRRARGDATRTRVIDAASDLFAAQGYAATSIAQIANAAEVQSNSLYHAFASKEGVLAAVVERASDDFYGYLEAADTGDDPFAALGLLGAAFRESPLFLRLLLVLVLERRDGDPAMLAAAAAVRVRGRQLIRRAVATQVPNVPAERLDTLLEEMGRVTIMLFDGAFIARQVDAGAEEMDRIFQLIAMALRGLLGELVEGASR